MPPHSFRLEKSSGFCHPASIPTRPSFLGCHNWRQISGVLEGRWRFTESLPECGFPFPTSNILNETAPSTGFRTGAIGPFSNSKSCLCFPRSVVRVEAPERSARHLCLPGRPSTSNLVAFVAMEVPKTTTYGCSFTWTSLISKIVITNHPLEFRVASRCTPCGRWCSLFRGNLRRSRPHGICLEGGSSDGRETGVSPLSEVYYRCFSVEHRHLNT